MEWAFGIAGLVIGWVLAVWLSRRASDARVAEVEAGWQAKLAQGDQAFAARLRDQEQRLDLERARLEEEYNAKLAAREAGWKNRLQNREADLEEQLQKLDIELTDRRRRDAVRNRPKPDDRFTDLDGIGKRTGELLAENDIKTFWGLANTPVTRLREILAGAGGQFRSYDPSSWPGQARLAAEGRHEALDAYKEWLRSSLTSR